MSNPGGEHKHKMVLRGGSVRVSGDAPVTVGMPGVGTPAREGEVAPQVELVREGDVIKAIDITCTCGKKLRLYCDY
jgi:hypothetical protein